MIYWNYSEGQKVPANMTEVLQKNLPEKTWGVVPLVLPDGDVDLFTIDKIEYTGGGRHGAETIWTHYANIQKYDDGTWEVNSQFKGKEENEMWIYGYYKNFGDAVRRVKLGIEKLKPIKVY